VVPGVLTVSPGRSQEKADGYRIPPSRRARRSTSSVATAFITPSEAGRPTYPEQRRGRP